MFGWKKKKSKPPPPVVVRDDRITKQSLEETKVSREFVPIYEMTHVGTREYQQDASCISFGEYPYTFAILCDGMGGMESGEKASRFVTEELAACLKHLHSRESIPDFLLAAVQGLNRKLLETWMQGETGTTLIAAIIWDSSLFWICVGDSRIYILRGQEMVQVSRDHNYGMELDLLAAQQKITEAEARENVQREALISYLGIPSLEIVDQNQTPFSLEDGDVILLCSDGLTKVLGEMEIKEVLKMDGDARVKAQWLMAKAMIPDGTSRDNTTVIVIQYPLIQEKEEKIEMEMEMEGEKEYEIGEM